MGLFGRSQDKDLTRQAEDIVEGRGLLGKLGRAVLGSDVDEIRDALAAERMYQAGMDAVAAGAPTTPATVAALADTGQEINNKPMVIITATLADGSSVQVQALVSRIQVPRPGDAILLVEHPAQPGTLTYAGLAA